MPLCTNRSYCIPRVNSAPYLELQNNRPFLSLFFQGQSSIISAFSRERIEKGWHLYCNSQYVPATNGSSEMVSWFRPQRGSRWILIVGPQLVSALAECPGAHFAAFVSARISRPICRPTARIAVLLKVTPRLIACGKDVALGPVPSCQSIPWIAFVPQ